MPTDFARLNGKTLRLWSLDQYRGVYVPRWGRWFPALWRIYDALSTKRKTQRERLVMKEGYRAVARKRIGKWMADDLERRTTEYLSGVNSP